MGGGRGWKYPVKTMIRLAYYGCTNRPFYHVVVIPHYRDRNAECIEQVGFYDPLPNTHNEKLVALNFDRITHWISRGAEPSMPVAKLLGLSGYYPIHPMSFTVARRNRIKLAKAVEEAAEKQTDEVEESMTS